MSWPKTLSVDKNIVRLLSSSTYEDFPRALRELVSNAYDADASRVDIDINKLKNEIVIQDNGSGMTPEEFGFFLRIAGQKRERSNTTLFQRKPIGQFGVGFLAMFPFCHHVEIESTVQGSTTIFRATIPAEYYCSKSAKDENVDSIPIQGKEYRASSKRSAHYTIFRLKQTNALFENYFNKAPESKRGADSITARPGLEKLRWQLQDILPVPYRKDSLICKYIRPKSLNFAIFLNKKQLFVNEDITDILLASEAPLQMGRIRYTFAIGTPWKIIKPKEARGIRIRLNNVGIGNRDYFDLNKERQFSHLHWLAGEINILTGLEDNVALDRESFTYSNEYEQLKEHLKKLLRERESYVETVDQARKLIKEQIGQGKRAIIAPKVEVLNTQVARLEKKGFKVIERDKSNTKVANVQMAPVEIDIKKRLVIVDRTRLQKREIITVAGKSWTVEYKKWDFQHSRDQMCKIEGRNVTLNRAHPIFSIPHKDIFKRLAILIAMANAMSKSKPELYNEIQALLIKEFVNK